MSGQSMTFELVGKVKPAVRMTRRGKWLDDQAGEYIASQASLGLQFVAQMHGADWRRLPPQTPLGVIIEFQHAGGFHRADVDNQIKAILDAMNCVVYPDDRWVDHIEARRKQGSADRTIVTVWEL